MVIMVWKTATTGIGGQECYERKMLKYKGVSYMRKWLAQIWHYRCWCFLVNCSHNQVSLSSYRRLSYSFLVSANRWDLLYEYWSNLPLSTRWIITYYRIQISALEESTEHMIHLSTDTKEMTGKYSTREKKLCYRKDTPFTMISPPQRLQSIVPE